MVMFGSGVCLMSFTFNQNDKVKYASAKFALNFIKDGMKICLGTGSTASWFVVLLGDLIRSKGINISSVSTSKFTKKLAESVGIEVLNLDELINLDLTVDGTDEFDDKLNLIKGGGGALLQEKIVASASSEMIVIADESKCVNKLGKFPLPVEVVPFGVQSTKALIDQLLYSLGYSEALGVIRSKNDNVFITDESNNIIDYKLSKIEDAEELSNKLNSLPGVVENGIFVNLCSKVIVAEPDGNIVLHTLGGKVSDFQNLDINEMNSLNAKILEIQNEI